MELEKDLEYKVLTLKNTLELVVKYCKVLVEQVDYLEYAINKDGNKRIEQIASEAKENLVGQVKSKICHDNNNNYRKSTSL